MLKAASRGKIAASNDEIENERLREVPAGNEYEKREHPERHTVGVFAVLSARLVTKTDSLTV